MIVAPPKETRTPRTLATASILFKCTLSSDFCVAAANLSDVFFKLKRKNPSFIAILAVPEVRFYNYAKCVLFDQGRVAS